MFSWATSHFEKISNTLAPPPADAAGRFVYCCQRDDEEGAMACVPELPGAGVVVNATKGQVPLHVACQASMVALIRTLLHQPGASLDQPDARGNSPLHAACTSSKPVALDVVKMLVTEFHANVTSKNYDGQTPYDVATLNSIRQYLLPIQLQKETQEALDNGGVGLPPGIDLGGLRISNPNGGAGGPPTLAPPPLMSSMMGAPIPPPPIGVAGVPGLCPPSSDKGSVFNTPTPTNATTITNPTNPPTLMTPPPMSFSQRSASTPVESSGTGAEMRSTLPSAPKSGPRTDYALSGHSSAAIYKPQGRRFIQPDGFHSSSSDKRLQEKYGHEQTGLHVPKVVPPPPSSGNAPLSGNYSAAHNSESAPPSLSAYNNPFAGGARHLTGRRYVAVDPLTGQQSVTPPTSAGVAVASPSYAPGYLTAATPAQPPAVSPNVTVFMPGAPPSSAGSYTSPSTAPLPQHIGIVPAPSTIPSTTPAPASSGPPVPDCPPVPAYPSPPQGPSYQEPPVHPSTVHSFPREAMASASAHSASWSSPQDSGFAPVPPALFGSGRAPAPAESNAAAALLFSSPSSEHAPEEAAAPPPLPASAAFDPSRSLSAESAASLFSSPSAEGENGTAGEGKAAATEGSAPQLPLSSSSPAVATAAAPSCFPRPPVLASTGKFALPPNMLRPQGAVAAVTGGGGPAASAASPFSSPTASALAAPPSQEPSVPAVGPPAKPDCGDGNGEDDDNEMLDEVPLTPGGTGGKVLCAAALSQTVDDLAPEPSHL